jgi:hypothetical protein
VLTSLRKRPLVVAALVGLLALVAVAVSVYTGSAPTAHAVWDAYYLYGPNATWDQAPGPLVASGAPIIDNTDGLRAGVDGMAAQLRGLPLERKDPPLTDIHSVDQLKAMFNQARGNARLIIIVSPT